MRSIYNGGLELGILQIVGDEALSPEDRARKAYLESLPKNKWIHLDENGKVISDEEALRIQRDELLKYRIR